MKGTYERDLEPALESCAKGSHRKQEAQRSTGVNGRMRSMREHEKGWYRRFDADKPSVPELLGTEGFCFAENS